MNRRSSLLATTLIGLGQLLACWTFVDAQESAQRAAAADKAFREIESSLTPRLNSLRDNPRLSIGGIRQQLLAPTPDWLAVAELELLFGEYSEDLDVADFSTFRLRWNEWLRQLPPPTLSDLRELATNAASKIPTVTTEREREARLRLQRALQNLDVRMSQFAGPEDWRKFLDLANLRNATTSAAKWTAAVDEFPLIEKRLRQGAAAWALPEMQSAHHAVLAAIRATRWLANDQFLKARADRLQTIVELLAADPPAENEADRQTLGAAYWWLKDNGTDFGLVAALEHHFVRPNFYLHWPRSFLEDSFRRTLEEEFPVNGFYDGTPVQGNGKLTGDLVAKLKPGLGKAVIDVSLNAQTVSKTVGFNSGVRVAATGETKLRGSKQLELAATGFKSKAADVKAKATVKYDSINTPGGRYGAAAMGQVQAGRPTAERDAEASASRYGRARLDAGVDEIVARFNSDLQNNLMNPLATQGAWPRTHWIRSADTGVDIALIDGPPTGIGPLTPPPEFADDDTGRMIIHSSMLAGIAQRLVGAKSVSGSVIRDTFAPSDKFRRPVTENSSARDDVSEEKLIPKDDWVLVFPAHAAVSIAFHDGYVDFHVRLAQFLADGSDYPGAHVSARYRCNLREGEFILQRDGEFKVRPLNASAGKFRLSGPQQVMRGILLRRLNAAVPREIDALALFGLDQSRGKISSFSMAQGWLTLSF